MNLSKSSLPFLALVFSAIIWGVATPVAKETLSEIPLFIVTFLRFLAATLVMAALVYKLNAHTPIRKKHIFLLILVGLLDSTINLGVGYTGLKLTSALDVIAIGATGPLMVATASYIFLGERQTKLNLLGQSLALTGVLLAITAPVDGDAPNRLLGDGLTIAAVATATIGLILAKELFRTYHALTITAAIFLAGLVSSAPLATWQHLQNPLWYQNVSLGAWTGLGFLAIFSSVVTYLAFEWGLQHSSASSAGISADFSVLAGAVLSNIMLGEKLAPGFVVGAGLILTGVVLATRPPHRLRRVHLR